jgi:tetratricopeptide (TPR) repeat protein
MKRLLFSLMLALLCGVPLHGAEDLASYERKAALDPKNADIQFNLGFLYFKAEQFDKAAATLKTATELNPKDGEAWSLFGKSLSKLQKWEEASVALQQAARIKPQSKDIQAALGLAWAKQGKMDEAVGAFEAAAKLDPTNSKILSNIGLLYMKAKNPEKALGYFEKAVKVDPKDLVAAVNLCELYNRLGNWAMAASACAAATKADPRSANAFYGMGFAYYQMKDLPKARQGFETALGFDPKLATAHYNLGFLDYEAGNLDAAVKHFEAALSAKAGDYPEARYNLAVVLGDMGRWEDAADQYRQLLAKDPNNADAKTNLDFVKEAGTEALLKQGSDAFLSGDLKTAIEVWNRVLKLDAENATAKQFLAKAKEQVGKSTPTPVAKVTPIPKVTRVSAEDLALLKAGQQALDKGKYKAAVNQLAYFVKAHPNSAEGKKAMYKARSRYRKAVEDLVMEASQSLEDGKEADAKKKLNQALDLDPNHVAANTMIKNLTGHVAQQKLSAEDTKKLYFQGVNLYLDGKISDAVKVWRDLLKQDPDHIEAKQSLARAEVELKSFGK